MRKRNIEEKIDIFAASEQLSCTDYQLLQQWACDTDAYIRDLVATLLAQFPNQTSEKILLRLVRDDDPLVRTDAYDSLSEYHSQQVLDVLKKAAEEDPDDLARSYAILSCADVSVGIEAEVENGVFFQTLRAREHAPICQLSCDCALYFCGNDCAHMRIFPFLNHPDYHIRCFAVSILGDIADSKNTAAIKASICSLRKVEKSVAVQSAIDTFLETLSS